MSALPSAGGGYGALHLVLPDAACHGTVVSSSEFLAPRATAAASAGTNKRKRRPAGTPDPGAEVVALSPKTLMESDRYVCEICNQGFQRDQNLQMHRRRHKVPWKLLKRNTSLGTNNKRVYICPERSCLHHDPAHALGDLVGIKKHYRRKHCTEKQWKCDKCSKGYAVQSDYKAHLKTCGTRGHCCDCGRVFSRVESFIEHQDTCSAVKHKAIQSGVGNDRAKSSSAPHPGTDRSKTSTGSPSQSSDTTQAMSITHSAMSDTTKTSAVHTKVTDIEHSRRIQASQAVAATPPTPAAPAMPPWLTDHAHRSELELLPSKHRQAASTDHHHSKPQAATRQRSSINFPYPEVSCPESKSTVEPSPREPSLQLSMGPCGAEVASSTVSPFADTKPSFSSVEKFLVNQTRQTSASNVIIPRPRSADLALLVPEPAPWKQQSEGGLETDRSVSLSGFLNRKIGDGSKGEHESTSTRKQHQQNVNSRTEMVANYNPCASISSYHEDLAANVHESDAPGPRVMSRRFTNSQLEPATSSVISNRQALLDYRDVAEPDHFFAANSKSMEEGFGSQRHMTAGSARAEATQAYQQARTDMNAAWSDVASMRLSKDEARQECDAAQRDIARAEILKREAREQLQFAAAERAYAERAREVAKRQIELSEAELTRAKRLREHAQSELANATALSPQPIFCHSCKAALDSNKSPPDPPSTWSFATPAAAPNSDQAPTAMSLWPSERFTMWPMSTSGVNIPPSIPQSGRSEQSMITPKLDLDLN